MRFSRIRDLINFPPKNLFKKRNEKSNYKKKKLSQKINKEI